MLICCDEVKTIIQEKLRELNEQLQKKCPLLKIIFDEENKLIAEPQEYLQENYKLCIYHKQKCISNIVINFFPDSTLVINSNSYACAQNKNYNKLSRCLVIIIASYIRCNNIKVKQICSFPFNPISAWLLMGYYTYEIPRVRHNFLFLKYKEYLQKNGDDLKSIVFNSYKYSKQPYEINVPITDENITKAYNIFNSLISTNNFGKGIVCMDEETTCNE